MQTCDLTPTPRRLTCATRLPRNAANWLPAPNEDFTLYIRAYWPKVAVTEGWCTPPAAPSTLARIDPLLLSRNDPD
jgi:hypothetical protein